VTSAARVVGDEIGEFLRIVEHQQPVAPSTQLVHYGGDKLLLVSDGRDVELWGQPGQRGPDAQLCL
jgi:hypothetical protein